jgi:ankyrin repeat protein
VYATPANGDTRLIEAVRLGNREMVRLLLTQGVDVNTRLGDGATALAWAVHRDDAETSELLIGAGADVDAANDLGVTPLSLACVNRNAAMVEKLLKARANPNVAQWSGETPLMSCARTGTVGGVQALLSYGADVNARTRRAQTAVMWAAARKHPAVTRLLVEHKADVNAVSHRLEGFAPAQYLTFGLTEYVTDEPSGETHEDPVTSKGGFTPLMFAARAGDLDSARILVAARANLNHIGPAYGSALVVAAAEGHQELAIFLVENGADPNAEDGWGFTALHYALQEGIKAIGMARAGIDSDRLWFKRNEPLLVKALLAHRADPNARVVKGFPPYNYLPFARTDNGTMPYLRQPGTTPFLLAAASTDVEIMRALLAAGADPRLTTEDGTTPLMVAAGLGKLEPLTEDEEVKALAAVRLVVEQGGDVNAVMKDGRTALMGAAHVGSSTVVEFLAGAGALLDAKDKYGQTALGLALGAPAPNREARGNRRNFRRSTGQTGAEIGPHQDTADLLVRLGAQPLPVPGR